MKEGGGGGGEVPGLKVVYNKGVTAESESSGIKKSFLRLKLEAEL